RRASTGDMRCTGRSRQTAAHNGAVKLSGRQSNCAGPGRGSIAGLMGLSMDGPAAYLQCVRQPESRAGVHSLITGCWSYETVIVSIRAQSWIPGADMARCIIPYAVAVLIGFPAPLHAQVEHSALVIDVAEGTTAEEQTRQQLQRITTELDLSRWLFTRRVRIEAMAIPHSHPVLTVNTRYLGND